VIRTSDLGCFISDFEERLAPVERAADEAWWNLATSGTDEMRPAFAASYGPGSHGHAALRAPQYPAGKLPFPAPCA